MALINLIKLKRSGIVTVAVLWFFLSDDTYAEGKLNVISGYVTTVALPASGASQRALTKSVKGCQSRSTRYPWGVGPFRRWTPLNAAIPFGTPGTYESSGTRTGVPFEGRLIQAYGNDVGNSKQSVIFEMPDGCRRQYRSSSFVKDDREYIQAEIYKHPYKPDFKTYAASIEEEGLVTQNHLASGLVKTYETQHFNIIFGTNTSNSSYRHEASLEVPWEDFIAEVGNTFEGIWQMSDSIAEAPMPYEYSPDKKKINIYICGTGLPFIPDGDDIGCGATSSSAVYADAESLQPGSTIAAHEFGHTVQFYTGGFRDKPGAGPVWETGAEWMSFTLSQTEEYFLIYYLANLENGPLWSNSRYASFPFMSFLFEQDKTRQFLWSTWIGNRRKADSSTTEEWTQTLVRQAKSAGIYPLGYISFADDMGWYGARLVTMDFLYQQALIDLRNSNRGTNFYTSLKMTAPSTYTSQNGRPLREWGTHIIPVSPHAPKVTVTVSGATTSWSAAWRVVLVSVDSKNTPRYSEMGKFVGTGSASMIMNTEPNEEMYLVVTATPYSYQSLGWQPEGKSITGKTFPYNVIIDGATPLTTPVTTCTSEIPSITGQNFTYNTNGRIDGGVPCD